MDTAYVLHRWPYQESSLMCDLLTRQEGRVRVIAKGARRPKSPWRSVLQPFAPIQVEYRGRSELQTLTHAEAVNPLLPALNGIQLYSAFYLNELVQRLTRLHQSFESLFEEYAQTLLQLRDVEQVEPLLRRFEWQLLNHLGLAFDWSTDCLTNAPLPVQGIVEFRPGEGFTAELSGKLTHQSGPEAGGQHRQRHYNAEDIAQLVDLEISSLAQLELLKRLMRQALAPYLGDQPLRSRELFKNYTQPLA
ncbi:DNA replication and repair protein RecO [Pseudidiomarina planktonica]|uniref:DNA repair protein RecO n=1 Tax=Pseudidiomarina planktonica TaxID=1323738 RepID=A0A1Y6ETU0_9GAMM|nr:DNA repair protein RecO [Pseudidiomarina planktonica]RUO65520.1 DNA repair protein RecO [Pseudidiomarina planktonica]SMQ64651.1 DNA replication and repair protein RecO [Pseudidiomarina planktonica]